MHGFDVKDSHMIHTYNKPRWYLGHQVGDTMWNTMGGSQKCKARVWSVWQVGATNGTKDKIINFMFKSKTTQSYPTQNKAPTQTDDNSAIVDYGATGFFNPQFKNYNIRFYELFWFY